MNKQELIQNIFKTAFVNESGHKLEINNSSIIEKVRDFYHKKEKIDPLDFVKYYEDPKNSKKGNLYFITHKGRYKPVLVSNKDKTSTKISIQTINNAYLKAVEKTDSENAKIIAYLFEYSLTREQILVLEGRRSNTDAKEVLDEYIKSISGSDVFEDIYAKMVHYLTQESIQKLTICINDLSFVLNCIPSIISFIQKGKKLNIILVPDSHFELESYRLRMLQKMGVHITVLPFGYSLRHYGVFPNWEIGDTKLPKSIFLFKASVFYKFRENNKYTLLLDDKNSIIPIINTINEDISSIPKSEIKTLDPQKSQLVKWEEKDYVKFIKSQFKKQSSEVYQNVSFSFQEIPYLNLYRRFDSFTTYKLYQQYHFIQFFIDKGYIKIAKNEKKEEKTAIFHPVMLELDSEVYSPINPPFIEFNSSEDRYEVVEGMSRLWVLFHIFKVSHIKTVVVKNIHPHYLKNKKKSDQGTDFKENNIWEETFNMIDVQQQQYSNNHYELRNIESVTHQYLFI